MSGALGTLPYPRLQQQDEQNPLQAYSQPPAPQPMPQPQPGLGPRARMLAALAPQVPTFSQPQPSPQLQPSPQSTEMPPAAPQVAPQAPPQPIPGQSRDQDRISTRIPSEPAQKAQGIDAHATPDLTIGLDSMRQGKEAWDKNAALIKERYPGFEHIRTNNPDSIKERFIQHLTDNLKFLHNHMVNDPNIGPAIVERSTHWYQGANRIAHQLASEYGLHPRQTAAVLAALSPQKDWFQNVDLARRLLEINQRQGNLSLTPQMRNYAQGYIDQLRKDGKNPAEVERLDGLRKKFETTPYQRITDPHERAVWTRWYDEAHHSRDYKVVTPEGAYGDTAMNPAKYGKRGQVLQEAAPRKVSWGSFNEIQKAMAALQTNDLPTISRLMGSNHKVRNFYNNIIAHDAQHGDVTIDTHAIAAALLRPLGASTMEVGHGLGTTTGKGVPGAANNATIGNKGMYGLYAEAYRRAAHDLGLLPRQLQSITWEGVRGLFSPEQKRDEKFRNQIDDIWRNKGQWRNIDANTRRRAIVDAAGGIRRPAWAGGADYGGDED